MFFFTGVPFGIVWIPYSSMTATQGNQVQRSLMISDIDLIDGNSLHRATERRQVSVRPLAASQTAATTPLCESTSTAPSVPPHDPDCPSAKQCEALCESVRHRAELVGSEQQIVDHHTVNPECNQCLDSVAEQVDVRKVAVHGELDLSGAAADRFAFPMDEVNALAQPGIVKTAAREVAIANPGARRAATTVLTPKTTGTERSMGLGRLTTTSKSMNPLCTVETSCAHSSRMA